jgi:hypothetical protein
VHTNNKDEPSTLYKLSQIFLTPKMASQANDTAPAEDLTGGNLITTQHVNRFHHWLVMASKLPPSEYINTHFNIGPQA